MCCFFRTVICGALAEIYTLGYNDCNTKQDRDGESRDSNLLGCSRNRTGNNVILGVTML